MTIYMVELFENKMLHYMTILTKSGMSIELIDTMHGGVKRMQLMFVRQQMLMSTKR